MRYRRNCQLRRRDRRLRQTLWQSAT